MESLLCSDFDLGVRNVAKHWAVDTLSVESIENKIMLYVIRDRSTILSLRVCTHMHV